MQTNLSFQGINDIKKLCAYADIKRLLKNLEFFTFGESVYGFLLKLKITFIIIQKRSP